jgi:hypothetical protein
MIEADLASGSQEWRSASARAGQAFFGAPVGILLLDCVAPFVPGSVGNASTWSVPVRYKTISGLTVDRILGPDAADHTADVVQAAAELAREGAQVITSNCGFTIRYQEAVRAAVPVPVLLSSLLIAPFLERMLPLDKALGIITASASSLTPELWAAAGLPAGAGRVVVGGLDGAPAFTAAFIACAGDVDVDAVRAETVDAAVRLLEDRPDVAMLLLECSELPPYAAAVQLATGVPVFDFTSMVEFFVRGLTRKQFTGLR